MKRMNQLGCHTAHHALALARASLRLGVLPREPGRLRLERGPVLGELLEGVSVQRVAHACGISDNDYLSSKLFETSEQIVA